MVFALKRLSEKGSGCLKCTAHPADFAFNPRNALPANHIWNLKPPIGATGINMFKKQTAQDQLEERIKQFEKETFERGLVEHLPPVQENVESAVAAKSSDRLKIFNRMRRTNDPIRVLIIDDEDQFRSMLRQFLESSGYEVVEAVNGDEGVGLFFEKPADIVISDIIMPEKEGIETVMEIKRQFPDAKVIVVSGGGWYGPDLDFDMAEKLGALTLKKPFELQELSETIQKLLN